jgi:hypothetical protein
MGGLGSGNWYRWNKKATVESQCKIDIRWMKKQKYLHPGVTGILSSGSRGEISGLIGLRAKTDRLVVYYFNQQNGGQWEQIEDTIFFAWTPCNYGGYRVWFLCPRCKRRIAIVYGGKNYRCRHCHNLTYSSQQENKPDRLMRKAWKIRERLEASGNLAEPILFKPKNMHWKTFVRLSKEAEDAGNLAMGIMWQQHQRQRDETFRWQ